MRTETDPNKQLAQHNALINARFSMLPLQMRLFVSMLSRQDFGQTEFRDHLVPFAELVLDSKGGSAYQQIDLMCQRILEFKIYIEKLEPATRSRSKKPAYTYINLISKASYEPDLGGVVASFNVDALPYLLQLRECGNFTTADLEEVQKLKSPTALRIYWLLKEYATFGQRSMSVEELRFVLDVKEHEYPQFRSFKAKVLKAAQEQLSATDMPFTYEVKRLGKVVQRVTFLFSKRAAKVPAAPVAPLPVDDWGVALHRLGVTAGSLQQIEAQLKAGEYPLDYIRFVVHRVEAQQRLGKIKKPAGAIYKALIEKYLLPDFHEAQRSAKPAPKRAAVPPRAVEPTPAIRYALEELRSMYDNPGPFAKKNRPATFELFLDSIYYSQGFEQQHEGGQIWLVKK